MNGALKSLFAARAAPTGLADIFDPKTPTLKRGAN
jgi:hypothetical protein